MKSSNGILLDTNALLWVLDSKNSSLGTKSTEVIKNAPVVYVSAASVFEIQIKAMLGKLKVPENLLEVIDKSNLKTLAISSEHAFSINSFPQLAKHDPFDRLLLSQAKVERLTFVTADRFLLDLEDKTVVKYDARV